MTTETKHTPTQKAQWVKARTRRHLFIDGKSVGIDAPLYKPGHDLPHVIEVQEFVEHACNMHDELVMALEHARMMLEGHNAYSSETHGNAARLMHLAALAKARAGEA